MNVQQFLLNVWIWLLADPTHIVFAASAIAAITPTPPASTLAGKIYKVLDLFALNFLHAKENGVTVPDVMNQMSRLLAQHPDGSVSGLVSVTASPTPLVQPLEPSPVIVPTPGITLSSSPTIAKE
jgi:hypothetical protein